METFLIVISVLIIYLIGVILTFGRLAGGTYGTIEEFIGTVPCEYKNIFKVDRVFNQLACYSWLGFISGVFVYYILNQKYFFKWSFKPLLEQWPNELMLTTRKRRKYYRRALRLIRSRFHYNDEYMPICIAIDIANSINPNSILNTNSYGLKQYPELAKLQPGTLHTGILWYPLNINGYRSRVSVLTWAIKNCK